MECNQHGRDIAGTTWGTDSQFETTSKASIF